MGSENLCDSDSRVDASLACSMKLNEGEVVLCKDSLNQEDVELERSFLPDDDNVARLSLHSRRVLLGSRPLSLPLWLSLLLRVCTFWTSAL